MFHIFIFFAVLLSVTTDIVQCRYVKDDWQMPVGITLHKVVRTWDKAQLQCQNEGAVIASPINSDLLNAMKSLIAVKNTFYFIGTRTFYNNSEEFMSLEGIPLDCMTSAVVNMVEKLDPYDGDCLSMDQHSIRAVPCSMRLPFMCYKSQEEYNASPMADYNITTEASEVQELLITEGKEQDTTTDMTEEVSTTEVNEYGSLSLKCSTGYTFYASTAKCYKMHSQEEYMTWDLAEATCVSESAHLAVIDDRTELETIADISKSSRYTVYIGLRYYNGWKSVHGTPVDELFNEWYSDEHLTKLYMECAAVNYAGQMDNFGCDLVRAYICEKYPDHSQISV